MRFGYAQLWVFAVIGVVSLVGGRQAIAQPFYYANGFAEHGDVSSSKVRKFPELIATQPIPPTVDVSTIETWPLGCQTNVRRDSESGGVGVKGAKMKFGATLYVLDTQMGTFEAFDLGSKKAKSDADGFAGATFEIPAAIFADGFESGDTLAWAVARLNFRGSKKAHGASLACWTDHHRQ